MMEKKQLKMYDAPAVEVMEMPAKASLLAGSDTNAGNAGMEGSGGMEDW